MGISSEEMGWWKRSIPFAF